MKLTTTKLALALLGATFVCAPVFAAPKDGAPRDGAAKTGGRRGMGDPAKRVEKMTRVLDLSPAQQERIKAILTDAKTQAEALQAGGRTPENRQKFRAIHESTASKIEAVLTPDQRTKWAAAREQMKNRVKEGGQKRGKGGPEAPAQPL